MTRRTRHPPAPLLWLAALLAAYLVAPFLAGLQQAGLVDWRSVELGPLLRACAVSVGSATLATAIIALGGIPLGYMLARVPGRATAALGFLVQLPLALPPLASGILLLFLLGYQAPLGRLTGGGLTDSFIGIVLAETFVAAPFLIIAARTAFAAVDPVLEDVAATLGRHPRATFLRVSLPLAWPTARAGLLLAWLRAFGEFGATVMVAYHPYSLPVYTYVAFGGQGLPAMLPVLLPTLAAALAVMALSTAAARRPPRRAATEMPPRPAPAALRRAAPARVSAGGDLAFRFVKRLDGFALDIAWSPAARRLAILGPSGSGKSLTLRLIAGLERSDAGLFRLGGTDLSRLPPETRGIAYVPQNYGLFPHLAVIEQLLFPVGADPALARHWLDRLGLAGLEHRLPAALSLGQQQRVALARALMRPAALMLLDEPFSALDAPLRRRLRRDLRALQQEIPIATILVTHDPDEAALLADEILVLDEGRVLQAGPTEAVFARPAGATVARLLGAENAAEGVALAADRIDIGGGLTLAVAGPPLARGAPVGWSVPPGRVRLDAEGAYPAAIEEIAAVGAACEAMVRLGDARLRVLADPGRLPGPGPCRLDIDPYAVQVWSCGEDGR